VCENRKDILFVNSGGEVVDVPRAGAKPEQELESDKATKTPIIDEKRNMTAYSMNTV
jgi:hypothetical protein